MPQQVLAGDHAQHGGGNGRRGGQEDGIGKTEPDHGLPAGERLAGRREPTDVGEVMECVAALDHAGSVVVTLGADGALCFEKGVAVPVAVPGIPTRTRDASGAGTRSSPGKDEARAFT